MRKAAGLLFAMSLLIPLGVSTAVPAGAAGAGCTKISGSVAFSPALPFNTTTVKPTITELLLSSGCAGGGVKTGTVTAKTKSTVGLNCANAAAVIGKGGTGTQTEVWNTKATSTTLSTLSSVKGKPTELKLTSKITAGMFKGTTTTGILSLTGAAPKGACTTAALKQITFASVGKITTK